MSDFRTPLYSKYVSAFKGDAIDEEWLQHYWTWCQHKYLPLLKNLDRTTPILDLGCGAGAMLGFLKKQGFSQAKGIDISEEQIQLAKNSGHDAEVADVFTVLEAANETYGAIIALDFVEHFSKDELMKLFPAIHKALKKDGLLILQTPNGRGLFSRQIIYDDLTHLTILTPDSLSNILRLWGFEQIEFFETGPVLANYKGLIRLFFWNIIKLGANFIRYIEATKTQAVWTENMICVSRKSNR